MSYTWVHAIIWPVLNALIGIIIFELSWKKTKPIREIDEARDSRYPSFRRYDAVMWKRWKFYPGAITFMFPRLLLVLLNLGLSWILTLIITIGFDMDQPLTGWRNSIIKPLYWFQAKLEGKFFAYRTNFRKMDFDYSYYLGKDYKETQQLPKRVSTYVSNHSSWFDPLLLQPCFGCGFAVKKELKNAFIAGVISKALGSIFVSRGGTPEELQKVVEDIKERQENIEEKTEYKPFMVFPEGGTSNGTCILPFKRGAFQSFKAVTPVFIKYKYGTMSPSYDVVPFLSLVMMNLCLFNFSFEVVELPPFLPNDYLFKTHADKVISSAPEPQIIKETLPTPPSP